MDQSEALMLVENEMTIGMVNQSSLLDSFASNDDSGSGRETLVGLRFDTSGEKVRFGIAVSVYALACLLQIAIVLTTRKSSVDESLEDLPPATPLDRAIGHLQSLNATPRNFERSEDIEVPDPPDTGDTPTSLWFSCFISMGKLILTIGIVMLCVHFLPITEWVQNLLGYIRGSGSIGCIILAVCYIPAALTGFAISVLSLSAGALYGPIDGTIVAVIGYNLGALAGFIAGRYLVRDCVLDWIRARRRALVALQVMGREGWLIILVCRICPLVPYAPSNYVFGITDVGAVTFLVSSVVAATPYTFISVAIGATVDNIDELSSISFPRWLICVLILALTVVFATALHLRNLGQQMLVDADAKKAARRSQGLSGTICTTRGPIATERGIGGRSGSSSRWMREDNPLNLSIASAQDDAEDAIDPETHRGSSSASEDGGRTRKMTPMQIMSATSDPGGSSSASARLPTKDEDEDEGDISLSVMQSP